MPRLRNAALFALICSLNAYAASEAPPFALLQLYPVMGDGINVIPRPVYLMTTQRLVAPTVFSGLQDSGGDLRVICCFEVADISPLDFKAELAKYRSDQEFVSYMTGVRGYTHVYRARPVADRTHWTPLMHVLMKNAADPADASPFSAPAIGIRLSRAHMSRTFDAGGATVTVRTRYDRSGRAVHSFAIGARTIVLSEPTTPHD